MKITKILLFVGTLFGPVSAGAETYLIDGSGRDTVIGELQTVEAAHEDTLIDIARQHDLGHDEIVKANPNVDRWVPGSGTKVLLPKQHILPNAKREGIVINLSELRLYYYPAGEHGQVVRTYPISVGRMDWRTPLGETKVVKKDADPAWYPPASIKAEHAAEGEILPDVIPGGDPTNPLGRFALRLGIPGYLLHGVDERKEFGIGMRVTHGCIRMYPTDVEELFRVVEVGTPVLLVDQPLKVGWRGPNVYLEIHTPLEEDEARTVTVEEALRAVDELSAGEAVIDRAAVEQAVRIADGIPMLVGRTASLLPPPRR